METLELVPLADVDAVFKTAAALDASLVPLPLPAEFRFRMKEIRVKRRSEGAALSPQCKLDVSECWMAYVPGCFAQPWGYRRALMVRRPLRPLRPLRAAR